MRRRRRAERWRWRIGLAALAVLGAFVLLAGPPATAEEAYETDRLFPEDDQSHQVFGWDIAIDEATALVGAPRTGNESGADTGAAYVFERVDGDWIQQTRLFADDPERNADVGHAVDLDGDTAILGAPEDGDASGTDTGAAYVFTRDSSGEWSQQAKLLASDGQDEDAFGQSVAVDSDTAVVGAPEAATSGGEGAVYVFDRSGGSWEEQVKLVPAGDHASHGWSLDLENGTALVGDPDALNETGAKTGAAYVYQNASGAWELSAKLVADDVEGSDAFGISLDLETDRALIAADDADSAAGSNTGAAYVYHRTSTGWSVHAKLEPSDEDSSKFGDDVALEGDQAVVGDPFQGFQGSAYLFERSSSEVWSERAHLIPSGNDADELGRAVALPTGQIWVSEPSVLDPDGFATGGIYRYYAPAPPADPAASPGPVVDAIEVTWQPPETTSDDLFYHVYRSTTSGGPYDREAGVIGETTHEDEQLQNQTYHYVLTAAYGYNTLQSEPSPEASSLPMAPPPPEDLHVSACGTDTALVQWAPPDAIPQSYLYEVQRTSLSEPYSAITTTYDLEHSDTGLAAQVHRYRLTAESEGGMVSDATDPVSYHPPPTAPSDLTVASDAIASPVELDWTASQLGAEPLTYHVYRGTHPEGPYALVATTQSTNYEDTNAPPGTNHYVVRAVDALGQEGPASAPASAQGSFTLLPEPHDLLQDDAHSGGDAADEPEDPTVLAGTGDRPVDGTILPGLDPVDVYGIRLSPSSDVGLEASFASPLGMGLRVQLVSPGGDVVDADAASLPGSTVHVQASDTFALPSGVWTIVLEHGIPSQIDATIPTSHQGPPALPVIDYEGEIVRQPTC